MSSQYKPSIFQKFFWLISGSEIHVLKDCKNDYNRHATMGFILFMTWLFATFAGGFAGWYFGHSLKQAIVFGIMWGLMIYAIDRGMVVSLKKNPTLDKQPFWFPFITRAVLGLVIAFFISIPFEILIFNEDIKIQMEKDKDTELKSRLDVQNNIYDTKGQENKISSNQSESDKLSKLLIEDCPLPEYQAKVSDFNTTKKEANKLYADYRVAYNNYIAQISNNPIDSAGRRILYQNDYEARRKYQNIYIDYSKKEKDCNSIKAFADSIKNKYYVDIALKKANIDTSIMANTTKLNETNTKIDSVRVNYEEMLSGLNGFTRQYVALNNASKNSGSLLFLMWLVRFAFFVIEILPTLYKLKTPIGDYDRAVYYREEMFKEELETDLESKKTAEALRRASNADIATKTEEHRKTKEVELNNALIDEVARVQTEIATSHLSEWEKKEKDSSGKKVDDFIKGKS